MPFSIRHQLHDTINVATNHHQFTRGIPQTNLKFLCYLKVEIVSEGWGQGQGQGQGQRHPPPPFMLSRIEKTCMHERLISSCFTSLKKNISYRKGSYHTSRINIVGLNIAINSRGFCDILAFLLCLTKMRYILIYPTYFSLETKLKLSIICKF